MMRSANSPAAHAWTRKGGTTLRTATIAGIVLAIIGVISLAYQGITYTTREEEVDLGPIEIVHEEKKTIPLPPILGAAALIGGITLLGCRREETRLSGQLRIRPLWKSPGAP